MRIFALMILGIFCLVQPSHAGDVLRGKMLFESPQLGKGTSGKTCLTCHEHGRDFSLQTLSKTSFEVMGIELGGIEEVINFCIEVTLRGEGLEKESRDMEDLLAYLEVFIRNNQRQ